MDFRCQDCHKTRNHMISGRSISVPAVEGDLSCEYCHTDSPHIGSELIDHHLNKHTRHVACQTCHIPIYSKGNPTKVYWDWSTAGQDIKSRKDKYGKPTYAKKKGSFQWKEAVKPTYRWYNGTVKRHLLGDRINENGATDLTQPVGEHQRPGLPDLSLQGPPGQTDQRCSLQIPDRPPALGGLLETLGLGQGRHGTA